MDKFKMLLELNKLDKTLSLKLALEIIGRTESTVETLEEEGYGYDETVLLKEIWDYAVNEDLGPEYDSAGFTEDDRIVNGQYRVIEK